MAEAQPREAGAPASLEEQSGADALRTVAQEANLNQQFFNVFRDRSQSAPVREEAFAEFLVTAGPWWDDMKPIEWAKAKARALVRHLARDNWSARDLEPDGIADEALMTLIRTKDPITAPPGFVFTAIRNLATWQMKDEWWRMADREQMSDNTPVRPQDLTEDETATLAFWERVGRGVNALRPRLRVVAQLHLLEHLSFVEVAARLKIPASTVRKRWQRAQHALVSRARSS